MTIRGPIIPILLWFIHHSTTCAETVTLRAKCPPIFSDHAIIQQGIAVPIWGYSQPGANVTVQFGEQVKKTRAEADGQWILFLDPIAVRYGFTNRPIGTTLYTQQGLPASPFTTESDWKILD